MRKAAIIAGLIPDTAAGNERLLFVTEGEASLHFCIQNGLPSGAVKVFAALSLGLCRLIADISFYRRVKEWSSSTLEEALLMLVPIARMLLYSRKLPCLNVFPTSLLQKRI